MTGATTITSTVTLSVTVPSGQVTLGGTTAPAGSITFISNVASATATVRVAATSWPATCRLSWSPTASSAQLQLYFPGGSTVAGPLTVTGGTMNVFTATPATNIFLTGASTVASATILRLTPFVRLTGAVTGTGILWLDGCVLAAAVTLPSNVYGPSAGVTTQIGPFAAAYSITAPITNLYGTCVWGLLWLGAGV